jgi:hypothetical protein
VSGDKRIQLDAVRPTPNRHVYEDRDAGGFRSHDGPCRDGNCVPYHRVCRAAGTAPTPSRASG